MSGNQRDGRNVIVIDDSEVDRALILELLEEAGMRALGLPSPIGATREVRRHQAACVIVDQNMPGMDGGKLASLFRGTPAMRGVRVVLVSSSDDDVTMMQIAREAKVDAFIAKADLRKRLVPVLESLLATGSTKTAAG